MDISHFEFLIQKEREGDSYVENYVYSATFVNESLDQVLKMLSLSAPIEFEILARDKTEDDTYKPQIIKLKKKVMKGN